MLSAIWQRGRTLIWVWLLVALTLAGPSVALAQQEASPAATGGSGGTMTGGFDVGPGGAPEVFNPLLATAGATWLETYFSKLVLYDVEFTAIQGELAESWEVSADGLQYTFRLQPGVTWHDGTPFTADDVKFTIDLVKNPESGSYLAAKFPAISEVTVQDPATAVIALSEPNAALLDALSFLVMLPKHALEAILPADLVQSDWWFTTPIGTGPFMWSQYAPGEYVELVAYDNYWRGRPKLDRLINRYYKEPGAAIIALRAGEIDFTYATADEAMALEGEPGFQVISGPSQVVNYLGFNLQDPRFADVRIRQAFMYAIDRQTIIDQLFQGTAVAVPCSYSIEAFQAPDANAYEPDPEMAQSLLTEAGWDGIQGEPLEILTYYNDQLSSDILVTIQQMLTDAGIEVTLRTVDVPTFNQIMGTTDWDIIDAGNANGPDPDTNATNFVSTLTPPEGFNRTYVNIPEVDALFAEGRTITDPTQRAAVYQEICGILNEQVPWAFMWVSDRFGVVSDRVSNFVWTPAPGGGRYYGATELWSVAE